MRKNIKKYLLSLSIAAFLFSPISLAHAANYTTIKYYPRTRYQYKINEDWNNYLITYIPRYKYNNTTEQNKVITEKESITKPTRNVVEKNIPTENNTQKEVNQNISTSANAEELKVVELVNIERKKAGLSPLSYNEELSKVARIKSQDMADKNYFSHNSPTYKDPFTMMKNFGIKYGQAGENIAKGYLSAESVMNGWMNSSGHRANILNSNFKKIGVGYVNKGGTTYWTQMFTD
ncbi:CAP domain-containing protein [Anaerosalibacter bizertensis]|uniref:CAP domain-containing protein n=1 Tax=Anaerosalibacter bizertensis TaxID=932217 RepID=A0A9Q4AEK6_9FIRM|nr:CAP domain-containing protein [Anaerosalibacter bizertensis]MBV1820280.1 hypothetical protein [Bacteroidales bacterium MSK.15.36]MCB5560510.1 CAP domain-containing protein [Anaerosalibacter bizertensis]MCG4565997.1 CAP domain-containing protein [Anaerosalibacter bizertensis]MCG4583389.1 CAP domain-containing protein [Anaerosalibacter bizertensis]